MALSPEAQPAPPCVWMSAGLVRYKLCDRELDCERCPLDAGLRGETGFARRAEELTSEGRRALEFPPDRDYTPGHGWLERRDAQVRLGLDALAAALMGRPRAVRWPAPAATRAGDTLCELELASGSLPLALPIDVLGLRPNPALAHTPELVASDPYGEGWLLEMTARDRAAPDLMSAEAARERARLDLRHFRRRVALALLADLDHVGATMADGGESLTDLRPMLGPHRYLALVRELVH